MKQAAKIIGIILGVCLGILLLRSIAYGDLTWVSYRTHVLDWDWPEETNVTFEIETSVDGSTWIYVTNIAETNWTNTAFIDGARAQWYRVRGIKYDDQDVTYDTNYSVYFTSAVMQIVTIDETNSTTYYWTNREIIYWSNYVFVYSGEYETNPINLEWKEDATDWSDAQRGHIQLSRGSVRWTTRP